MDPVLRPSQFADIQVNAALALAKRLGMPPRDVAARIVEHLDVDRRLRVVEISGPGFLNLTLAGAWIGRPGHRDGRRPPARRTDSGASSASRSTTPLPTSPRRCMSATSARPWSATHWPGRSSTSATDVIRQNHIGDWGTPFGMLIEHLLDVGEGTDEAMLVETDPNAFYQAARAKFDGDPSSPTAARARVVALQAGDAETLRLWRRARRALQALLQPIYGALGVTLTNDDLAGESMYNDDLAADLRRARGRRDRNDQRGRALRLPRWLHRPRGKAAYPSSSASPTVATGMRRPIWPRSGTGSSSYMPTASCT